MYYILRWHSIPPRVLETLFYGLWGLMMTLQKDHSQPDFLPPPPHHLTTLVGDLLLLSWYPKILFSLSWKFNSPPKLCSAMSIYNHIFLEHPMLFWSAGLFLSSSQGRCLVHLWGHSLYPSLGSWIQATPVKIILEHLHLSWYLVTPL